MKTYTQINNKKPFDWNKFLDRAIKGKTTEDENIEAENLAQSWVTCACGNQCAIIPRHPCDSIAPEGTPMDEQLAELGQEFFFAIEDEDFKSAKHILKRIEKRSAKIIEQETKKTISILRSAGYKVTKM